MPVALLQPALAVELVDETGSTAELRPNVARSASAAEALAAGVSFAQLAEAASSCSATRVRLRYTTKELRRTGTTGSEVVGVVGVLIFETSTPDEYAVLALPGIKPALRLASDPTQLDLAAPALAALIDAVINGLWVNAFNYDITNCVGGIVEMRV